VRWWKWLGLAGVAGVTATGIVVAQAERRRRAYTAGEVRDRLHARLEEASQNEAAQPDESAEPARHPAAGVPARGTHRSRGRAKLSNLLRRGRRIRHSEFDRQ
jgi:hypothetical protein